jgi:aspartyl protease family protein
MGRLAAVLAASLVAANPSGAAAQQTTGCKIGQSVADDRGSPGTIVDGRDELCLVKYKDGQRQSWIPVRQLGAAPSATGSGAHPAAPNAAAPNPAATALPADAAVAVWRPAIVNRLVYEADALGHIVLTARVNGAPVRFLVDTGATLLSLTPEDASAAGLKRGELTFNQKVTTGNGQVNAALVQLRQVRIEQFEANDVRAAVIDSLKQSVLGMSFLGRLKSFEMREGVLTMIW